jgi:hypothetical protein
MSGRFNYVIKSRLVKARFECRLSARFHYRQNEKMVYKKNLFDGAGGVDGR